MKTIDIARFATLEGSWIFEPVNRLIIQFVKHISLYLFSFYRSANNVENIKEIIEAHNSEMSILGGLWKAFIGSLAEDSDPTDPVAVTVINETMTDISVALGNRFV